MFTVGYDVIEAMILLVIILSACALVILLKVVKNAAQY